MVNEAEKLGILRAYHQAGKGQYKLPLMITMISSDEETQMLSSVRFIQLVTKRATNLISNPANQKDQKQIHSSESDQINRAPIVPRKISNKSRNINFRS